VVAKTTHNPPNIAAPIITNPTLISILIKIDRKLIFVMMADWTPEKQFITFVKVVAKYSL
jgi:hypothetical protein